MIPLRDENPFHRTPVVTIALIVANIVVFLWQLSIGVSQSSTVYGLVPAALLNQEVPLALFQRLRYPPEALQYNFKPAWVTVFTSMFMHGGIMHILSNMWFLWLFGNNVEDRMGRGKFILFYLLCGIAAAGAQVMMGPTSPIPMIGASGAVAGVLGAYLFLFPGSRIICLTVTFIITTIELPAWVVLSLWFVIEFVRGLMELGVERGGGVAYAAHVGGFLCGWLLIRLFAEPGRRPPPRPHAYRYRAPDWR
jgi:membrane associated rhomboid family serine protease